MQRRFFRRRDLQAMLGPGASDRRMWIPRSPLAYTVGLVYDLYSIRGKKLQLCASQIISERNLGTEAAFAFAFVRYSEPPSITKSAVRSDQRKPMTANRGPGGFSGGLSGNIINQIAEGLGTLTVLQPYYVRAPLSPRTFVESQ